ncbi:MAG: histidine triad nucleotide-binding protein [Endomicrobium sp.]|jgi:histidine triad (HIT) family protein|nr:histidine triad nucleotide-binding protein [Endomicrobium sp.]
MLNGLLSNCIFCRIGNGDVRSDKVYEDEEFFAFKDINPQSPVHVVVIPKKHISDLSVASDGDKVMLGCIQLLIAKIAKQFSELNNGFRVVSNCGYDAGQTVFHMHYHLLGGRIFAWPPG